jgi:ornithine carbamoyltransferase
VINLLSDASHPCQALADLLTIQQHFGKLEGIEVAYIGDFNNVARSLAIGAAMAGMSVRIGCPPGYAPSAADVDRIRAAGAEPLVTHRADEAAEGVDVIYADVWASMGQESESDARKLAFEGFTIDEALMARAASYAVFLHCLPAHRGQEVAASVCDGPQSRIWQLAENRMHAQRGLLVWLLGQTAS